MDNKLTQNIEYQEGLLSIEQAQKNNLEFVYSDHSPIIVKCAYIKIFSWNLSETGLLSGFSLNGETFYIESTEQIKKRSMRIVEAMFSIIEKHKPHFIALQEINKNGYLYEILCEK